MGRVPWISVLEYMHGAGAWCMSKFRVADAKRAIMKRIDRNETWRLTNKAHHSRCIIDSYVFLGNPRVYVGSWILSSRTCILHSD